MSGRSESVSTAGRRGADWLGPLLFTVYCTSYAAFVAVAAFATFAGVVSGTDWTPSTATNSTTLAKMQYNIDLRGRKRYLKVTMEHATTGLPSIVADLSLPSDGISDSAAAGVANSVGI